MTKNLLLEIGLEEIPAHIVTPSSQQLVQKITAFLKENRLEHGEVIPFSTPRRLAVIVKDIAEKQEDVQESVKGPAQKIAQDAEGNWSKAAIGFARGQGATTDDIYFKSIKDVDYVYVDKFISGKTVNEILVGLDKVITSLTFPVSMHWADHTFKYIRPFHWLTAMLDDEVIPFELLDIQTANTSRGHRFLGHDVTFADALAYEETLESVFVIADSTKRKQMIVNQIEELVKANQWSVSMDEELLEEVNNLIEYPTAFYGSFDQKYLNLPEEVLITSMKDHQRYFGVRDSEGAVLPYFISVRNGNANHIETVARGNEKVLTARLDDGQFFFEEDQKLTIAACVERLKQVTFHEKIGSIYEKMNRVQAIAQLIGKQVGLNETELTDLKRASEIYKFDLVTNMVGEFPELQGIMGEKYALTQGETPAVAAAIREHYMPVSSEGELPKTSVGAVLAIADKLESVLSFFAVGMTPTGSNDPYALRRQTYGIVRIIESKNWNFPMESLKEAILSTSVIAQSALFEGYKSSTAEVVDFIKARIRQLLLAESIRHDVIDAALNSRQEDLLKLVEAGRIINSHLSDTIFKPTIEALTRVVNLANKGEAMLDQDQLSVDPALFETNSEQELYEAFVEIEKTVNNENSKQSYTSFEQLQPLIEAFFNENMVMADNQAVRNNRLALLMKISSFVLSFASVDKLVVK
ncbi:glycyl-tRNA synthetase, beta subunit [Carnobacterium sp. AT7]|uniref:glycine--tRNA ligase subunit beta n=1 Tax=Carnobacterium TaxID=2747 RepID=UPI00015EF96E|nr:MULTISPECIES: glycine--tRNA ligase subunit beta [Carnobacterium]EDP67384.1 glycyl-tRNA synthetase, beta subunit [Carnobacterium sp. AT7]